MATPSNIFEITRKYVDENFNNHSQMIHFDRTVYWLKQLKPDAEDYLLVAAMGHDLERAFRNKQQLKSRVKKGFLDKEDLIEHQEGSAKYLQSFLREQSCDDLFIKKVMHLVSRHEVGGDEYQNLLKDADSVSFLENNSTIFLKRINELGQNKIKEKFDWMYKRISSSRAKEIAKPFYNEMIKSLDEAAT